MQLADALARLAELPSPLPAGRADLLPVFTDGRLRPRLSPTGTARPAAVLVLLFAGPDGAARLVLTERMSYDGHHSGEVSFPGGKAEPSDDGDPTATALREASEEVGLAPTTGIRVLGRLDEVFIPVSDFRITPVLATVAAEPRLVPNPSEVARILTPPIDAFLPDAPVEIVERRTGRSATAASGSTASMSGVPPPGSWASSAPCSETPSLKEPSPAGRPILHRHSGDSSSQ